MERTVDTIIEYLEESVRLKRPVSPGEWLDACQFLSLLMGDETDKLLELQQKDAQAKLDLMEAGKSAAHAKIAVEASENYKCTKRQEAKIDRVVEMIRISKLQARMRMDEFHSG